MLNLRKSLTRFSKLALAAVVAVPAIAMTMPALAAPQVVDTEASVIFTQGSSDVDPVDPTDPTAPGKDPGKDPGGVDPVDPGTGLALNYVTNFKFGSHQIDSATKEYEAENIGVNMPFAQITDVRGGSTGWKLKMSASKFTDGTNTVTGPSLLFKDTKTESNDALNTVGPSVTSSFEIVTGAASIEVAKADQSTSGSEQGVGTWLVMWPEKASATTNENVKLKVPAGSIKKAGTYKAVVTWTLEDTI